MQVNPTASSSTAFAGSHQFAASALNAHRSSRSPSAASARSSQSYTRPAHSPSPLRRLVSEQQPSSSNLSSSPRSSSSHAKAAKQYNALPQAAVAASFSQAAAQAAKLQKQKEAALDSQMQALYEAEYREDVLEYMYEMEVSRKSIPAKT